MNRRGFLARTLIGTASLPWLPACSSGGRSPYDDAVREMMNHSSGPAADRPTVLRGLVRYAILAASSHNTQPWKFALGERSITVLPDFSRRTPVVDPDDHHLFVSLGCAIENLAHAALAIGLHPDIATKADRVDVAFEETGAIRSPLFDAIPLRQCSRSVYDGQALSVAELQLLERAGHRSGVDVIVLVDKPRIETILEYVVRGNEAQIGDPAFVSELRDWIRFNEADALRTRDGLFSRSTGNRSVPRWVGRSLLRTLLTPASENEKVAAQLRSSAGVAVFVSHTSDRPHWIEVGRAYERFALQATTLGIRTAFLNQPVEVPALRAQFAGWLGLAERRPDLLVRFGRGPKMPRSLRRPLEDVLV